MLSRVDVVVSRAEYMNEKENVCKEKRSRFRHKIFMQCRDGIMNSIAEKIQNRE
jgi:hypothetical protein